MEPLPVSSYDGVVEAARVETEEMLKRYGVMLDTPNLTMEIFGRTDLSAKQRAGLYGLMVAFGGARNYLMLYKMRLTETGGKGGRRLLKKALDCAMQVKEEAAGLIDLTLKEAMTETLDKIDIDSGTA